MKYQLLTQFADIKKDVIINLKKEFESFINKSKSLSDEQKKILIEELSPNDYNHNFDTVEKFVDACNRWTEIKWNEENRDLSDLWRKVAINNASQSFHPGVVATETVREFKKQFIKEKK